MALSKEQVGLIFRLDADSKPAQQDIEAFATSMNQSLAKIDTGAERSFRRVSDSATGSSKIAKEAYTTAASEIIESWGVDGDIANEVAKMFTKLPAQAQIGIGAVIATVVAATAAVAVLVVTTKQILDVADKIGTDSKDDFDKFAKSIKAAGGEVTSLDRAMSQELMRSVEAIQGATDNLFLVLIRESGPELVLLLRQVSQILRDSLPLAQSFGHVLSVSFSVANATLKTFVENWALVKQMFTGGALGSGLAIGQLLTKFDENLTKNLQEAQAFKPATPEGFKGKGGAKDPLAQKLALIKAEGEAAIIAAEREIELAERLFKTKSLFSADYVRIVEQNELAILAAKQKTFEAERQEIDRSKASHAEKAAKLQQLANEGVKAQQETETKIFELKQRAKEADKKQRDEEIKDEIEHGKKRLEQFRNYLQERNKLVEEIGRARIDTLNDEAGALEVQARTQPRFAAAAQAAREQAKRAELTFQRELYFIKLNASEQELLLLATTEQQKADIQKRFDDLRAEAIRQFQIRRQAIEDESTRNKERQNSLSSRSIFGDAFADALANDMTRLQAFSAMFADWQANLQQQLEQMPSLAETAFGAITQGLTEMATAFVLTGETGPAAMRQLAAGVLGAIAKMAATKAIYELAEGFAALARGFFGDPRGFIEAGHHFTAAAIYGTVAAVSGLAGRAVAPSAGGGGGGGFSGGRSDGGRRVIEQGDRGKPQVIIVQLRAEMDEGISIRRVVEDYKSNGQTRAMVRGDILGE